MRKGEAVDMDDRDNKGVISILGYMKIEGKTPSGGDYIEAFPKDDEGNPALIDNATNAVIHECRSNGEIVLSKYVSLGGKMCVNQ